MNAQQFPREKQEMTMQTWLQHIESLHPKTIELGLERVYKLAQEMQLTTFDCPVVVVGGTNGKGSCVKFLETILSLQGYKVAAYTSPHLLSFNERIRINNQNITDDLLLKAFEAVEGARGELALTFFEFTTLAAFWSFKKTDLDVIILEVGLGGRLDAVNIIDADIAIITSVDLDHTDWLGSSREQIGFEKAGIFRQDRYAIIGDDNPPASMLDQANKLKTRLYQVHNDFSYQREGETWHWSGFGQSYQHLPMPKLPIQNAATSLMALTLLSDKLPVSEQNVRAGLSCASLRGRFQRVDRPAACILDVAHNEASAKLLALQCSLLEHQGRILAVVGMLSDKDIANTLKPLQSHVSQWYFGTLSVPRGANAALLVSSLEGVANPKCYTYDCVIQAFEAASIDQADQDIILVFGSFFTVAEVLQHITI
jgi:dihydrofolate synthase/folylpolyglutamate synthase